MKTKQGTIYIADDGYEYTTEEAMHWANVGRHLKQAYKIHKDRLGRSPGLLDIPEIVGSPSLIPACRAYLEYAKLKWPEEFNKT